MATGKPNQNFRKEIIPNPYQFQNIEDEEMLFNSFSLACIQTEQTLEEKTTNIFHEYNYTNSIKMEQM